MRRSLLFSSEEMEEIVAGRTRVGWIGCGVMGLAMCRRIQSAGFSITVYNRTQSKAVILIRNGATMVDSPELVAQASDVVFTSLGGPADVRQIILGENGVLSGLRAGGIVVDTTSSGPALAREIYSSAALLHCEAIDAPVSGGDCGAREGSLVVMAGGREEVVRALEPIFSCVGKCTYMGPAGTGQSCKLANQITVAANTLGLVEGMVYAHKAGLDVCTYIDAVAKGAAGSKAMELYAKRILKRDFAPGGFVDYLIKDLGIALVECRRMGLALPGAALAQQLYLSLKAHGDGTLGAQALILALERMNNINMKQ